MHKAPWLIAASVAALAFAGAQAIAVAGEPGPAASRPQEQSAPDPLRPACGRQLMSDAEHESYRTAMRALETPEERERLRKSIHESMKVRARELGLTLPDDPPAQPGNGRGGRCKGGPRPMHGGYRPATS